MRRVVILRGSGVRGRVLCATIVCAMVLAPGALATPAVKAGAVGLAVGSAPVAPPAPAGATLAAALLYDNTGQPGATYYTGQGGAEAIDDLHLVSGGSLDTLTFEYFDAAAAGPFSATVRIYDNPGGSDAAIAAIAGPYVVEGLSTGRGLVSVPLADSPVVGADLWVGIRFSSTTAGLIIHSDPSVGASHDLYLENGDLFWFGGEPKANFALRLAGQAPALAVAEGPGSAGMALAPVRPNPVRTAAAIGFTIARRGPVRLAVFDAAGRRVCTLVDGTLEPGAHTARWSGQDDAGRAVTAGVYFLRLVSPSAVATRRLVLTPAGGVSAK